MRFEIGEPVASSDVPLIIQVTENRIRATTRQVERVGNTVFAKNIDATFGSINRYTEATFSVRTNGTSSMLSVDVLYRPSAAFWIILIITFFTAFGWIIPIAFYLYQKGTVRSAIEGVIRNVKTECEFQNVSMAPRSSTIPAPPLVIG